MASFGTEPIKSWPSFLFNSLAASSEQEEEGPAKNCGSQTHQDQDDQLNVGEKRTILFIPALFRPSAIVTVGFSIAF